MSEPLHDLIRQAQQRRTADREELGRLVREVWIMWAREQPNPKPSWLQPWEALTEPEREVDRRIGATLEEVGRAAQRSSVCERTPQ